MSSKFEEAAAKIGALVAEKNAAYGDAFAKAGEFLKLLYPSGIRPGQYADMLGVVRVFDKQMRIATDKDALGESPWSDIAGYGILGVVNSKKEVPPSPQLEDPEDGTPGALELLRDVRYLWHKRDGQPQYEFEVLHVCNTFGRNLGVGLVVVYRAYSVATGLRADPLALPVKDFLAQFEPVGPICSADKR